MLYPPRWTANSNSKTAGAAGACILLRRAALERAGGLAAIRSEVIEDCALARAVKQSGGKIWMGLTRSSSSRAGAGTFMAIRDMIARTAFTQLGYSSLRLMTSLVGLFATFLLAGVVYITTTEGIPFVLSDSAIFLMILTFVPTVRFFKISPFWALTLPIAAIFYGYATCVSAVRYWLGGGGQWKGRAQAPRSPGR
jgi:Glycosyl transferase family 21